MSNKESNVEKTNFDAFIQAVGSEIEQAQVRLSWVTPGFSQSRRCKTTASEFELGTRGSSRVDRSQKKHRLGATFSS